MMHRRRYTKIRKIPYQLLAVHRDFKPKNVISGKVLPAEMKAGTKSLSHFPWNTTEEAS